jgi:hypothetical protein
MKVFGRVLVLFALLISFGDAFKLHRWVPLPLLVLLLGLAAVVLSSLSGRRITVDRRLFPQFDVLLLAYLVVLGVSLLFSGHIEGKNINHLVAYTTVVAVYYFFVKFLFAADDTYVRYESHIRGTLAWSVLLVSIYTLLEFLDRNGGGWGITRLVWFPADIATENYRPLFLVFVRARGFMSESAMLALFLNTFAPMSFVHLRRTLGPARATAFLLIALAASLVTFSVGAVIFITLGLLLAVGMYAYDRGLVFVSVRWSLAAACFLLLTAGIASQVPYQAWQLVADKVSLVNDPASGYDRMRHWTEALPAIARHPLLGTGIGSTSAELGSGVISFYLTMLKEAGIPALLLILAFFALMFREITRLPRQDPYKYVYAASFVAAVCHYAIISDIWYPWFWLLCVFIIVERRGQPLAPAPEETAEAPPDALSRVP